MIPFENEASLTETEEYVEGLLQSQWDYVVRSTSGVVEDLRGQFPNVSESVSVKIMSDTESELSSVFRPGVPDFLAFDDNGDYLFVEVKSSEDGLRHTQLKWLRDFRGINAEIWFSDSRNDDIDELEASSFDAYSFRDVKSGDSGHLVEDNGKDFVVSLPKDLASVLRLSDGDMVSWRLKSKDELVLDTR